MNIYRIFSAAAALLVVLAASASATTLDLTTASDTKLTTDTISVPQMQCGSCETKISKALKAIDGVSKIDADAEADIVVVTYDPAKVSRSILEQSIASIGYTAGEHQTTKALQNALPKCCQPGGHE